MTEYSSESGHALAEAPLLPDVKKFADLPLTAIVPSLTNPRKTFDAAKLTELADSIRASGIHQPILVRPLPGSRLQDTFDIHAAGGGLQVRPIYEIVAGERRYRACKAAGLDTIPAMIRAMTDTQVLEAQIVENLQRDDLSALEEAEGYEHLCTATGITKEEVGAKIGKSRAYVYGRLKLLDLSHECKQALRAGSIDASRALLIARIPDSTLQTKALAEASRKDFRGEVTSVRTFQAWLQLNVMLRLEDAPFRMTDATLTKAGSCKDCPKRTGANPDLFIDVPGADICTDPVCYYLKVDAQRVSVLATAAAKGMRLIEGEEAEDCFLSEHYQKLKGYSPLSQERQDVADGVQPASLGVLLGKDAPNAVLIENPWTKELTACVPTAEAEALLLARGLVKAVETKAASKDDIEAQIKRLQDRAQKDIAKRFRDDAFEALADAVHALPVISFQMMPGLVRAWWLIQVDDMSNADLAKLFRLELVNPDVKTTGELQDAQTTQMRLHVQACDSVKLYKALALWMALADCPSYFYGEIPEPTLLQALATEVDVDLDSLESEASDAVQDEYAAEIKTLKAQLKSPALTATGYRGPNGETWSGRGLMPRWLTVLVQSGLDKEAFKITPASPNTEKSPLPLNPAAQADGGGVGKAKSQNIPAAPASGVPARKRKMNATEAQAAIASAMQDQESDQGANAQGIEAASGFALSVGVRVCVVGNVDSLPLTQHKWAGREGKITAALPLNMWRLTFAGRNGGMANFRSDQLIMPLRLQQDQAAKLKPAEATPAAQPSPQDGEPDPLYEKAVAIVKEHNKPSIAFVQRTLNIGYNQAARLLEQMEQAGLITAMSPSGTRLLVKSGCAE